MAAESVLEPLTDAGLTARVRTDGRLLVTPAALITPVLDAYIRAHRDELIAALAPLAWPPLQPDSWVAWMKRDDHRRGETMRAGLARRAAAHTTETPGTDQRRRSESDRRWRCRPR